MSLKDKFEEIILSLASNIKEVGCKVDDHILNGNHGGIGGGVVVNTTPLSYIPSLTGNTENLGELVTDSNGDKWLIGINGNAASLTHGQSIPSIVLGDLGFACTPKQLFGGWEGEGDAHVNVDYELGNIALDAIGGGYKISQDSPIQIPFRIGYKVTDRTSWLVVGLSKTIGGVSNAQDLGLLGLRYDNHYLYTNQGADYDPSETALEDIYVEFVADASGVLKMFFDGEEEFTVTETLLPSTDYYPTINNGGISTVEFYKDTGYTYPSILMEIKRFDEGSTYEVVVRGSGDIVLGEFIGENNGEIPLLLDELVSLESKGLVNGDTYTIYVRDKDFPDQLYSVDQQFTYSDCIQDLVVDSDSYSCIVQPISLNAFKDYDGQWLDDTGVVGTQLVTDSDDDGQLNLQTGDWTTGQTLPEELQLPLKVTWDKKDSNNNFWLNLIAYSDIGNVDPGYLLANSLSIQSAKGYGAYTRGLFGDGPWGGAWNHEFEIEIIDNGDGTSTATLSSTSVAGVKTVLKTKTGLPVQNWALSIGHNADISLDIESPTFIKPDKGQINIDFTDPNGALPYELLDSNNNILATTYSNNFKIDYEGDGNDFGYKLRSKINNDIVKTGSITTSICS